MDILVVGAGTMGRWFGSIASGSPTFIDVDHAAARQAAAEVGGTAVSPDNLDQSFDLVCIAVPMSAAERAIREYGFAVERAIIDVTGSMAQPIETMRQVCPDAERASYHPLFAPANGPGSVPVVVDHEGTTIETINQWLRDAGNRLIPTTPAEHDQAMESIQAAAHTAILAYGMAVDSVPDGFETPVSAQLDALVEQVAGGDPAVYAEIQQQFSGADRVAEAATDLASADPEQFMELYDQAMPASSSSE